MESLSYTNDVPHDERRWRLKGGFVDPPDDGLQAQFRSERSRSLGGPAAGRASSGPEGARPREAQQQWITRVCFGASVSAVEAVIFDLDGLIVDSETPEYLSWQATYARYGLELPLASWLQNVGRNDDPFDPMTRFRQPDSPAPPEAVHAVWREYHDAFMREYLHPLPGVVPLLTALRHRGMRTAVASSSQSSWIQRVLTEFGLGSEFDVTAGGDEVPRGKPAPDVYLLAARRLGAAPEACVALEDSQNGVRAAKSAGMSCIAVPSALTRHMDFSDADLVVGSLAEVTPDVIAVLGGPSQA